MEKENSGFQKIYPFTTENIAGYFSSLNMLNKSVLTVGSSLDQAFNALIFGAKDVCVFDINENVYDYYQKKKKLILTVPREELCMAIFRLDDVQFLNWITPVEEIVKRNLYLQYDAFYENLRNRLEEDDISFVTGNIFAFDKCFSNEMFDVMIFSNILSYIDYAAKEYGMEDTLEYLSLKFPEWDKHLNNEGLLQLIYYYNFNFNQLNNILGTPLEISEKLGKNLYLKTFDGTYNSHKKDGVLVYKKEF